MVGGSVGYLLFSLCLAALVYQIMALICGARFFQDEPPRGSSSGPGVTIFKPLKGRDAFTRDCLESFLTQDYRPYQVLFGVADPEDPVLPLLEELKAAYPELDLEIHLCSEPLGLNPKISTLRQLEGRARHDLLVISDGDVKVGRDFLSRAVAALQPGVGLVTCPYRGGGDSLGGALEALTIAADFIPSVAVAYYLEGIRFALGAAMVIPRGVLEDIGGFAPLADFLADDYQLGWRVAQAGYRVQLIPYAVETKNPSMTLKDYLLHQLRWTRTYRVCRPKGYLAYGITHALTYALAFLMISGSSPLAWGLVGATLLLRGSLAWLSQRVWLKGEMPAGALLLLPAKDLLAFGLWLLSFLGSRVTWQQKGFRVTPEGKLVG